MKVAVLRGGRGGEHDISLVSAEAVAAALVSGGHELLVVTLGREGGARWETQSTSTGSQVGDGRVGQALDAIVAWGAEVVFIAMHGAYGEDGRVQGALELLGVPYQGTDVTGSAVAMDKGRAKAVYRGAGLPVSDDVTLTASQRGAVDWGAVGSRVGFPCVLKTAESGSSVGIEVIRSPESLKDAGERLLASTTSLVTVHVSNRALINVLEGKKTHSPSTEARGRGGTSSTT